VRARPASAAARSRPPAVVAEVAAVSSSDGSSSVSPLWVLLGIPAGLLAAFDPNGAGVWWAVSHLAVWVWGWPYVAAVVSTLAGLAVLVGAGVVGFRMWRRREW
jgi:hypothetical protein